MGAGAVGAGKWGDIGGVALLRVPETPRPTCPECPGPGDLLCSATLLAHVGPWSRQPRPQRSPSPGLFLQPAPRLRPLASPWARALKP